MRFVDREEDLKRDREAFLVSLSGLGVAILICSVYGLCWALIR